MIPMFMSVEDIRNLVMLEIFFEKLQDNFRIGRIDKYNLVGFCSFDDIGIVVLEQWKSEDTI